MSTTPWETVRGESLAAMNPAERAEYDAAAIEAESRLRLAELVYDARTTAGLSQAELARRTGTRVLTVALDEDVGVVGREDVLGGQEPCRAGSGRALGVLGGAVLAVVSRVYSAVTSATACRAVRRDQLNDLIRVLGHVSHAT